MNLFHSPWLRPAEDAAFTFALRRRRERRLRGSRSARSYARVQDPVPVTAETCPPLIRESAAAGDQGR